MYVILCLAVSVEHRQADRQTQDYGIYCASVASSGKNRLSVMGKFNFTTLVFSSILAAFEDLHI